MKKALRFNMSQVFLKDFNIKEKICSLLKNDEWIKDVKTIIEVGVGSGETAKMLIKHFPRLDYFGIEIDNRLATITKKELGINIINENYLATEFKGKGKALLFSSIPYHSTTKFIENFIKKIDDQKIIILAFIIQKEAFNRLLNDTKHVFYTFRDFFKLKKKLLIKKQCFKPMPRIDSVFSIWHLKNNQHGINSAEYLQCVKTFNNRRNKNIVNNLKDKKELSLLNIISKDIGNKKFLKLSPSEKENLISLGIQYFKQKNREEGLKK